MGRIPKNKSLRSASTDPGELGLIASIRQRADGRHAGPVRLGIGDDCAILRPAPGKEIAVTTDLSLENVHFRRDWHSPESVGHRSLARGLSDLAAMGAEPGAAFLSLALPPELTRNKGNTPSWLDRFLDGFLNLARRHNCSLAGGDTAQSPVACAGVSLVVADIVLVGQVARNRALLRSGAEAGDTIYVTGSLGGAAAELLALERDPWRFRRADPADPKTRHPHLFPEPRISAGRRLVRSKLASAAIDLSDGLSSDLSHLCEESGLRAEIDSESIPVDVMARLAASAGWAPSALRLALHGGEDYELLFTAPESARVPREIAGVPVHAIGRMSKRRGGMPLIALVTGKKREALMPGGWQHFRSR
jgi:thiamine-monophosphate kinase